MNIASQVLINTRLSKSHVVRVSLHDSVQLVEVTTHDLRARRFLCSDDGESRRTPPELLSSEIAGVDNTEGIAVVLPGDKLADADCSIVGCW